MSTLEQRLAWMTKVRDEAKAALRMNKEKMKEQSESGSLLPYEFKVGDLIRLASKDVKIHQKSPKLGPMQLGPFKVLEQIGGKSYRLELPHWLKIHDVISVDRLAPWNDNGLKKPPPPAPVKVDGEEEYKVEEILDFCFYNKQFQYLVKWKGYPGEDQWEPLENVKNAKAAVNKFHKAHPGAPRVIKALIYADLLGSLQATSRHTQTDLAELQEQYPDIVDLDWETGKYI